LSSLAPSWPQFDPDGLTDVYLIKRDACRLWDRVLSNEDEGIETVGEVQDAMASRLKPLLSHRVYQGCQQKIARRVIRGFLVFKDAFIISSFVFERERQEFRP